MTDPSAFEQLDQLEELETALDAALGDVREGRQRLLDGMTDREKWTHEKFCELNSAQLAAEKAAKEAAEAGAERVLTLEIRSASRCRTIRAVLRDERREREIADLARAGIVDATGRFLPTLVVGFGHDADPGDGEAEPA